MNDECVNVNEYSNKTKQHPIFGFVYNSVASKEQILILASK
jgi:hypothetical protein